MNQGTVATPTLRGLPCASCFHSIVSGVVQQSEGEKSVEGQASEVRIPSHLVSRLCSMESPVVGWQRKIGYEAGQHSLKK
jgi:hypothetical protein